MKTACSAGRLSITVNLRAVAFLEFLVAAAWARVVAANVFQGVAHGLLVRMAAVRAMDMAMLMIVMVMIVIVVAIRAMHMGLLVHRGYSGIKSPGIISPLRPIRTL
jgi:hypothetical protein